MIFRLFYQKCFYPLNMLWLILASALKKRFLFKSYKGFFIDHRALVKYSSKIHIGRGCVIGRCVLGGSGGIIIGENVTISYGAIIETGGLSRSTKFRHTSKPIEIGDNVWICAGAIVLGGSKIPNNFTVPAGAIYSSKGLEKND